jgi:hypothetical protein
VAKFSFCAKPLTSDSIVLVCCGIFSLSGEPPKLPPFFICKILKIFFELFSENISLNKIEAQNYQASAERFELIFDSFRSQPVIRRIFLRFRFFVNVNDQLDGLKNS